MTPEAVIRFYESIMEREGKYDIEHAAIHDFCRTNPDAKNWNGCITLDWRRKIFVHKLLESFDIVGLGTEKIVLSRDTDDFVVKVKHLSSIPGLKREFHPQAKAILKSLYLNYIIQSNDNNIFIQHKAIINNIDKRDINRLTKQARKLFHRAGATGSWDAAHTNFGYYQGKLRILDA